MHDLTPHLTSLIVDSSNQQIKTIFCQNRIVMWLSRWWGLFVTIKRKATAASGVFRNIFCSCKVILLFHGPRLFKSLTWVELWFSGLDGHIPFSSWMGIQILVILQECRRVWGLTLKNVFHKAWGNIEKAQIYKSLLVKMFHGKQRFGFQLHSQMSLVFNIYISSS